MKRSSATPWTSTSTDIALWSPTTTATDLYRRENETEAKEAEQKPTKGSLDSKQRETCQKLIVKLNNGDGFSTIDRCLSKGISILTAEESPLKALEKMKEIAPKIHHFSLENLGSIYREEGQETNKDFLINNPPLIDLIARRKYLDSIYWFSKFIASFNKLESLFFLMNELEIEFCRNYTPNNDNDFRQQVLTQCNFLNPGLDKLNEKLSESRNELTIDEAFFSTMISRNPELKQLFISLTGDILVDVLNDSLASLKNLKTLHVAYPEVHLFPTKSANLYKSLQELGLHRVTKDISNLMQEISNYQQLQKLYLDLHCTNYESIKKLSETIHLLKTCPITELTLQLPAQAKGANEFLQKLSTGLPHLKKITLTYCKEWIKDPSQPVMQQLAGFSKLEEIILCVEEGLISLEEWNKDEKELSKHLGPLTKCTSLKILHLPCPTLARKVKEQLHYKIKKLLSSLTSIQLASISESLQDKFNASLSKFVALEVIPM